VAFATENNWIIASLVFLMGVTIRHWFNSRHARQGSPTWTWLATALIFLLIAWLSTAPLFQNAPEGEAKLTPAAQRFAAAEGFDAVQDIVLGRCSMCHATEPGYEGIHWAPKGVRLETSAQIAAQARKIYLQAGVTHAMPPANVSFIEPEERAKIVNWYRSVTQDAG
jgi:uncharacterized membrane protein